MKGTSDPPQGGDQGRLFDRDLAHAAKRAGMSAAAAARASVLDIARVVAFELAEEHGVTHADAVQERLISMGITPDQLGNAAGSVFRGSYWRRVGGRPSSRVSRHANRIGVWALEPAASSAGHQTHLRATQGAIKGLCYCGCGEEFEVETRWQKFVQGHAREFQARAQE